MNRLLSRLATDGKNHAIKSTSLLHGLCGDHEVLSEKIDRLQSTVFKIAVNQFLDIEAAEAERKEQREFRDEFRVDAYRKDGSLDF